MSHCAKGPSIYMHLMLDLETDNKFQCVKHFDALSSSGRVVRMIPRATK
jgi:hypothetical protein